MSGRKETFGAGAEGHARFKQYDYRAVSAVGVPWSVADSADGAQGRRVAQIRTASSVPAPRQAAPGLAFALRSQAMIVALLVVPLRPLRGDQ